MTDVVTLVAVTLMLAGIAGSFLPMLPSGILSLAGVYTYYYFRPDDLGVMLLISFTLVGLAAAVLEHFAGAITAKASGAKNETVVYAGVAAVLLFFVTGPIGILLGLFGVVFYAELKEGESLEDATRRACYSVAGMLGSTVVQALLTISILVGFVLFVLVI